MLIKKESRTNATFSSVLMELLTAHPFVNDPHSATHVLIHNTNVKDDEPLTALSSS